MLCIYAWPSKARITGLPPFLALCAFLGIWSLVPTLALLALEALRHLPILSPLNIVHKCKLQQLEMLQSFFCKPGCMGGFMALFRERWSQASVGPSKQCIYSPWCLWEMDTVSMVPEGFSDRWARPRMKGLYFPCFVYAIFLASKIFDASFCVSQNSLALRVSLNFLQSL